MVNLQLDPDVLKPLIEAVVRETVAKLDGEGGRFNDKIAFAEPEAARLLGLEVHQLRDERLRGRIRASQIVGKRIRYLKSDLLDYLLSHRWTRKEDE